MKRKAAWDAKKGGFKKPRQSLSQQQKKEVDQEVRKVIARKTAYKITDVEVASSSVSFSGQSPLS